MKLSVRSELQTTPERSWAIYFDSRFNKELRTVLRVSHIDEHFFEETDDHIKMSYTVTVLRNLPDWVRKITGDISFTYTAHDTFDKHKLQMETRMVPEYMPSKIRGTGRWSVRSTRPGWVMREYDGDISIALPVVGKKMEERLVLAIQEDFAASNELIERWVQRDLEAVARGEPLPTLLSPGPLQA